MSNWRFIVYEHHASNDPRKNRRFALHQAGLRDFSIFFYCSLCRHVLGRRFFIRFAVDRRSEAAGLVFWGPRRIPVVKGSHRSAGVILTVQTRGTVMYCTRLGFNCFRSIGVHSLPTNYIKDRYLFSRGIFFFSNPRGHVEIWIIRHRGRLCIHIDVLTLILCTTGYTACTYLYDINLLLFNKLYPYARAQDSSFIFYFHKINNNIYNICVGLNKKKKKGKKTKRNEKNYVYVRNVIFYSL